MKKENKLEKKTLLCPHMLRINNYEEKIYCISCGASWKTRVEK